MIQSLVESFVKNHNNQVDIMKLVLESSDIPVSYHDVGYPVYTFSDESWIMFHGKYFTTASPRKIK